MPITGEENVVGANADFPFVVCTSVSSRISDMDADRVWEWCLHNMDFTHSARPYSFHSGPAHDHSTDNELI